MTPRRMERACWGHGRDAKSGMILMEPQVFSQQHQGLPIPPLPWEGTQGNVSSGAGAGPPYTPHRHPALNLQADLSSSQRQRGKVQLREALGWKRALSVARLMLSILFQVFLALPDRA